MRTNSLILPVLLLIVSPGHVHAAPVTVANPGFEADFATDGTFPVGQITGWPAYDPFDLLSQPGNFTGVVNPTGTSFFNFDDAPEGRNAALLYFEGTVGQGPIGLSQSLDAVLTANTIYTLTVEVGNIASGIGLPPFDSFGFYNLDGFPGYSIQLLANGVVLAEDFNSLTIPEGEFGTATASVSIGSDHPMLGVPLEIRLINLNLEDSPGAPGIEVDFDVVRLDASATGCNSADLAEPFGVLDLADIGAFVSGFTAQIPIADLDGNGVYDLADINLFISSFLAGCP